MYRRKLSLAERFGCCDIKKLQKWVAQSEAVATNVQMVQLTARLKKPFRLSWNHFASTFRRDSLVQSTKYTLADVLWMALVLLVLDHYHYMLYDKTRNNYRLVVQSSPNLQRLKAMNSSTRKAVNIPDRSLPLQLRLSSLSGGLRKAWRSWNGTTTTYGRNSCKMLWYGYGWAHHNGTLRLSWNVAVQTYGSVIATYKDEEGIMNFQALKSRTNQQVEFNKQHLKIFKVQPMAETPEGRCCDTTCWLRHHDNETGDVRDGEIIEVPYVYRKNETWFRVYTYGWNSWVESDSISNRKMSWRQSIERVLSISLTIEHYRSVQLYQR